MRQALILVLLRGFFFLPQLLQLLHVDSKHRPVNVLGAALGYYRQAIYDFNVC